MAGTSSLETPQAKPPAWAADGHAEGVRSFGGWLLKRIDGLLSERLRRGSPSELTRARLVAGAALLLLLFDLLYLIQLWSAHWPAGSRLTTGLGAGGPYVGLLVLLRRAATVRLPALLLCAMMALILVGTTFAVGNPYSGTHAGIMLLPALAVYLLGPRWAFPFTLVLIATLGFAYPFYVLQAKGGIARADDVWEVYLVASFSFLGAWGLGALHSTARDQPQASLEQALKEKRASEAKLLSLIESTDDLVCSLDLDGRLITANSALQRMFALNLGQEAGVGDFVFAKSPPERQELWKQRLAQVARGQSLRIEEEYTVGGRHVTQEISLNPIHGEGGQIVGVTLFCRDVTLRKEADARLKEMHRTLVDVSRHAGMAEIATGVLHNVGNTLNSVNIATALLMDQLRRSRVTGLARAAQLLRENLSDAGTFVSSNPQGRKLPRYFIAVAEELVEEREKMSQEVLSLIASVDHIRSIVTVQQQHARTVGALEEFHVPQLIDEALRLDAISLDHLGITIVREYAEVPPLLADRHRLLQILINLLSNARQSLVESQRRDKQLIIRIRLSAEGQHLLIDVADNGLGIAPEQMERIFKQGFTTKKTGHGFGLHISALAATEMKGRLTCASPGPGQGATFTLELPLAGEEVRS
jgi:PAS domain S-box-containing protein